MKSLSNAAVSFLAAMAVTVWYKQGKVEVSPHSCLCPTTLIKATVDTPLSLIPIRFPNVETERSNYLRNIFLFYLFTLRITTSKLIYCFLHYAIFWIKMMIKNLILSYELQRAGCDK